MPSPFKVPQGALRAIILAYASKYPVSGAELSKEMEERTGGRWKPSPGSVYFLMNELEGRGLLVRTPSQTSRKSYITTRKGMDELRRSSADVLASLERDVAIMGLLSSLVAPEHAERMELLGRLLKADPATLKKVRPEL